MYRATIAADLNYDAWITEEESNISPWMKILCNPTIIKTFHFDKIDKVQCLAIHQKWQEKSDAYGDQITTTTATFTPLKDSSQWTCP